MKSLRITKMGVAGILILPLLLICFKVIAQSPPLSNLKADADTPLYTTYAAHMERSEFALDEGYHFRFYKPNQGLAFTTDTGGDWILAFKRNDTLIYKPSQMYRKPVITISYTDLVKYFYYPFKNIRVEATFLVQSSHFALQDITVENNADSSANIEVISLLRNRYRTFNKARPTADSSAILFRHKELPDGWVLGHDVPYVADIKNVFMMSSTSDKLGSYHRFHNEPFDIPHQVTLDRSNEQLIWGEILHENGERCRHSPPHSSILGFAGENMERIITHNAPRWGSADRNITGYGFYGLEWGNLVKSQNKDSLTFRFFCKKMQQSSSFKIAGSQFDKDSKVRRNIRLSSSSHPSAPENLQRSNLIEDRSLTLQWNGSPSNSYHIYRRTYGKQGDYQRIAANIQETKFRDSTLKKDEIYGYIVIAVGNNGAFSPPSDEITNIPASNFISDITTPGTTIDFDAQTMSKVVSLHKKLSIKSGQQESLRIIRGVSRADSTYGTLVEQANSLINEPLEPYINYNEKLYGKIPELDGLTEDQRLLYWSAYSLMRQVMLPPEGQLNHNYYVFSREPTWGWGHGGQVFHESLTMLAYAYMDPVSAMNSQRVYDEVQHENGYINYRTGAFLNEVIEVDGQKTTSAPWYAWQNWMLYKITKDREFLQQMYQSSKAFHSYYVSTRDTDNDGLHEWGGHAVLESVRDAQVAVWDKVAWPTNFEALGLNTMLVSEEKALAKMADELGKTGQAKMYRNMARKRSRRINKTMWDSSTGFYYHVDKKDNDFTYESKHDLKRKEIIGFLPLWAGVADKKQAEKLVSHLTDTTKFWRKYGIPSLSADDPYYNPRGYWNGPVWVEWNYLIEHGLKKYGYHALARRLVNRVADNMIQQLRKDHNLWEFYSPDRQWAGYHKTYIWAGIINRMLMDTHGDIDPESQ